jgi:PAS domain S-box-containing protein
MDEKPTYEELENRVKVLEKEAVWRKQAEEALRDSEEKFRSIFRAERDAIMVFDDETYRVIEANDATFDLYGYTKVEFLKLTPVDISAEPEETYKAVKKIVAHLPIDEYDLLERKHKRKDGTIFLAEISTSSFILGGRNMICYIVRDVTKRVRAKEALRESEEKLARSKKMESLGLLAGGVAHDLNNVLAGLVSYPELLLLDLPENSKLREPIETMQESGHRAAAIVQDMLTVARGVTATKEPLNLNDLVSDYLHSPEFKKLEQFHPTVTIKINLNSNLLNITGSHVHIRKVIMNLVSNASEAIEGSGNVIISTMNRYIDRPLRGYDDVSIGEYAVLAVSDDGPGISSGDFERIFDPFFTKKVMGRSGTGLGLAVVWNVVQDHEGYIEVKSNENSTMFEVYFSITRDEISDKALSIHIKDYKGDGERILVVDDVESQREISCKMLDTLGYKTKAVSSGEEAIEYLKENTVDLILLDMIMDPGINGRETYERIIKIHPNQKAIITSGFAETDDVKKAQKLGAGQYIKKPLALEMIGIAVRDELKK